MKWRTEEVRIASLDAGVAAVAAASHQDRPRWFVVTREGRLLGVDLDGGTTFFAVKLPFDIEHRGGLTLTASPDGRFVAAVQTNGVQGALYEVPSQRLIKALTRGDYHPEVSAWAIALTNDRCFIATDWNRLEVWSLPSCERLRPSEAATLEAKTVAWHLGSRTALSLEPFAHHWLTGTLGVDLEFPRVCSPAALSVLADALEERGGNPRALAHLRAGEEHGRTCWVTR